jgi:hypothetical protein
MIRDPIKSEIVYSYPLPARLAGKPDPLKDGDGSPFGIAVVYRALKTLPSTLSSPSYIAHTESRIKTIDPQTPPHL